MSESYSNAKMARQIPGQMIAGGAGLGSMARPASQKEQLIAAKEMLEGHLARVNAALQALDEHPEIERVMTLVSQALY